MSSERFDDGDDIDAAFDDLIAREWPDAPPAPSGSRPNPAANVGPGPVEDDPPTLFDWVDPNPEPDAEPEYTLDHVEPDPEPSDDDWRPTDRPLHTRFAGMSGPAAAGAGLLALAMLVTIAAVAVPAWRGWAGVLAVGSFALGLVILFSRLPRNRPPSGRGDGAVV